MAKHAGGRPTEYTPELVKKAKEYFETHRNTKDMPSIAELSLELDISRETVYEWAKDPAKKEFSDIVDRLMALQELSLTANGLLGTFNPTITKLMLTKHGYTDKSAVDHNNPDGNLKTIIINKHVASKDSDSTEPAA